MKIATITKLSSGSWRVQVRRKTRTVSETFIRYDHASEAAQPAAGNQPTARAAP
jgi:hypothetical protein